MNRNSAEFRMAVFFYKKELTFYKVTDALFMFVKIFGFLKYRNAVQICLMAVIRSVYHDKSKRYYENKYYKCYT